MTKKVWVWLESWSYNEGRKLRQLLNDIKNGKVKLVSVDRNGIEDSKTIIEIEEIQRKYHCIQCGIDDYCFKNPEKICPIEKGLISAKDAEYREMKEDFNGR